MTIRSQYRGKCATCGGYFEAGTEIEWARGNGARHLTAAECDAARAAQATQPRVTSGSHRPIADFLAAARERGLKFPKVRFLAPDGASELTLWLAGARSKAPGSVQVKVGEEWVGRVEADGAVVGRRLAGDAALLDLLTRIAADPAEAARAYGALTSRCSFCHLPLTDEGSVEVGYGPVCARRYGLPHRPRGTRAVTAMANVAMAE